MKKYKNKWKILYKAQCIDNIYYIMEYDGDIHDVLYNILYNIYNGIIHARSLFLQRYFNKYKF